MTLAGVAALRAEIAVLDQWATHHDSSGHDWTQASKLPGWSHLDVLAHIDDLLGRVVEPEARPGRDDDVASRGEAGVRQSRTAGTSASELIDRIRSRGVAAAEALEALQVPVAGDLLLHFGSIGQHPTHLWADGLVFELIVHRAFDLGAGPIHPTSVAPAVAWLVSALPQVALAPLHAALAAPVAFEVGQPVGTPFTLWRIGAGVGVGDTADGPRAAAACIRIDPVDLLRLVSGRARWRALDVVVEGDADLAANVLDAARL